MPAQYLYDPKQGFTPMRDFEAEQAAQLADANANRLAQLAMANQQQQTARMANANQATSESRRLAEMARQADQENARLTAGQAGNQEIAKNQLAAQKAQWDAETARITAQLDAENRRMAAALANGLTGDPKVDAAVIAKRNDELDNEKAATELANAELFTLLPIANDTIQKGKWFGMADYNPAQVKAKMDELIFNPINAKLGARAKYTRFDPQLKMFVPASSSSAAGHLQSPTGADQVPATLPPAFGGFDTINPTPLAPTPTQPQFSAGTISQFSAAPAPAPVMTAPATNAPVKIGRFLVQ